MKTYRPATLCVYLTLSPPLQAYTNIGNAIFAMIGSGFLFFSLIGLVLFLFIWPFSRHFMVSKGLAMNIVRRA